jgi:hypothetical protein
VNKAAARALAILGLYLGFFSSLFTWSWDCLAKHYYKGLSLLCLSRRKWKFKACHKRATSCKARTAYTFNGWRWNERSGNCADS